MTVSLRTNAAALGAQRHLRSTQAALDTSLARLSSGFRITRASDDAAGLGISTKLESQLRSQGQAVRNANDGISVVQAAEAGLGEQASVLERLRELAMQAGSDGVGGLERAFIDREAQALLTELQRISQVTEYNGTRLLDGSAATLDFQVGIRAGQSDVVSIRVLDATVGITAVPAPAAPAAPFVQAAQTTFQSNLAARGGNTLQARNDAQSAALAAGAIPMVALDAALATEAIFNVGYLAAGGALTTITSPGAAQAAGLALVGATAGGGTAGDPFLTSAYDTFATTLASNGGQLIPAWNAAGAAASPVESRAASAALYTFLTAYMAVAGPLAGNLVSPGAAFDAGLAALGALPAPQPAPEGMGLRGLSLSSKTASLASLGLIDGALEKVSAARAELGAAGNRLQSAISTIQTASEALSAANSRIKDADVAEETSRLSRAQILVQVGVSVLAQANQAPQLALRLLG